MAALVLIPGELRLWIATLTLDPSLASVFPATMAFASQRMLGLAGGVRGDPGPAPPQRWLTSGRRADTRAGAKQRLCRSQNDNIDRG